MSLACLHHFYFLFPKWLIIISSSLSVCPLSFIHLIIVFFLFLSLSLSLVFFYFISNIHCPCALDATKKNSQLQWVVVVVVVVVPVIHTPTKINLKSQSFVLWIYWLRLGFFFCLSVCCLFGIEFRALNVCMYCHNIRLDIRSNFCFGLFDKHN